METERNAHHVYRIMYHFVWIPKYRKKIFNELYRGSIKAIIQKVAYDYGIEVEEIEVPEDHIHLVVKAKPRMSPAWIMNVIKSISAREFFKKYPEVREKYYWGGKLWTSSYFVETAGNMDEERLRKYVREQLNEMDKQEEAAKQLGLFD